MVDVEFSVCVGVVSVPMLTAQWLMVVVNAQYYVVLTKWSLQLIETCSQIILMNAFSLVENQQNEILQYMHIFTYILLSLAV